MTAVWVVLAVVAVALLGRAFRVHDVVRRRRPRPGEDMARVETYGGSPGDWPVVLAASREEATIARGLLEASGIRCTMNGRPYGLDARMAMAGTVTLHVAPEDEEQARELLGEQVVDDPGHVGAE